MSKDVSSFSSFLLLRLLLHLLLLLLRLLHHRHHHHHPQVEPTMACYSKILRTLATIRAC
jgi:hypothetical protein